MHHRFRLATKTGRSRITGQGPLQAHFQHRLFSGQVSTTYLIQQEICMKGVLLLKSLSVAIVRDENLKKLLMSWYYAGYYTGLYEGQQKTQ